MGKVASYAKAIVAALIAGLSALITALDDGTVTAQEWATIASATLIAFGAVAFTPWMPEGTLHTVKPIRMDPPPR